MVRRFLVFRLVMRDLNRHIFDIRITIGTRIVLEYANIQFYYLRRITKYSKFKDQIPDYQFTYQATTYL